MQNSIGSWSTTLGSLSLSVAAEGRCVVEPGIISWQKSIMPTLPKCGICHSPRHHVPVLIRFMTTVTLFPHFSQVPLW